MIDDEDPGFATCEYCDGQFDAADMDGEHCRDCSAELFGDES